MKSALKPICRAWCKLDKSNKTIKHGSVRFIYAATDPTRVATREIISVNEATIKDKLKEFSVPFTDGYTCFHIKDCSVCSPKTSGTSSNPDIYINKKTGFFLCKHCKITGNWFTFNGLLRKSKLEKKENEIAQLKNECLRYDKDVCNWRKIVETTTFLHQLQDHTYENVFEKFKITKCSKIQVEKLQIRISKTHDELYFPLLSSGNCIVGYKSLNINGQTNTLPKSDCAGFLLQPNRSKSVVVVANIPDFFALVSLKLPYQILCLPYGISSLPQSALPFLENYNKIILWLGNAGALDATGNFAKKLNDKRCYVIRPTENYNSALTALENNENIESLLQYANPTWHEFIITFNSLREEVLCQLHNKDIAAGVQLTRYPQLNQILKGHRRGELTILTGPTGSGKTTFISEYSLDLAMQGVNTLWGSFEIKNSRLVKIMLQQFCGGPLSTNEKEFNQLADKFEQLPLFFMTFHGQQSLSKVMDAVEHCSYIYDIGHVVIDNVQFMIEVSADGFQVDRFWKQDCLIQAFRSFATKSNCHVTLVMHPKKGMDGVDLSINSIFGGAKAAQEADNVFIIQNKRMFYQNYRKVLQVCKNRFSGDLGSMPLNFDKTSLSFAQKEESTDMTESQEFGMSEIQKYHFSNHYESQYEMNNNSHHIK